MSSIKTNYFYNKLNEIFRNDIKLSFVSFLNIIIITKEDKVYEFDRNAINNSLLIFSNNKSIIEHKINESLIEELSNKGIIDFKNSNYHTIARTFNGKLYCWGSNWCGVLGNGREVNNDMFYKPELNEYLKDKHIIEMSCGFSHSLVLTIDGEVYGWGENDFGQIGNRKSGEYEYQAIPYFVNQFNGEAVKAISCGFWHSLALTESGVVYSWGKNDRRQLGRNCGEQIHSSYPKPIDLNEGIIIDKISCGNYHSLLLSREGEIYVFGSNCCQELGIMTESDTQLLPLKLNHSNRFKEIASQHDFYAALSMNGLYYIWGKVSEEEIIKEPKETLFKSFNEMFSHYCGINYKAINENIIKFNDDFIRGGFYEKEFNEIEFIGIGSFGEVLKAKKTSKYSSDKENFYAIKKIKLEIKNDNQTNDDFTTYSILKELELFSVFKELENEKIVTYYDLWLENEFSQNNCLNLNVFIRMELCDKSLKKFMEEMSNDTKLVDKNCLTIFGYYISCEMFIQILEGVNYLHTRNTPIIHRDLTPQNILIKINENNNSVVKIADLGLAVLHKSKDQKHTQDRGTITYAAPEALDSNNYDTRADIYSLGIIAKELFLIDINRDYKQNNETSLLMNKYQDLNELCDKMTQNRVNKRNESCQQILNDKHLWTLSENEFNVEKELKVFCDNCDEEYKKSYQYKLIQMFFDWISVEWESVSESEFIISEINLLQRQFEEIKEFYS